MPEHLQDDCASDCLHHFAAIFLPTDNPLVKAHAKPWFRDRNVDHAALLRLLIVIAPELLEAIECPETPNRKHIVRLLRDGGVIKLERVHR
ncbi:hypothetical protein V5O48_016851, partial [Marasmius crinis-equi]